jgi:hypothetical protein
MFVQICKSPRVYCLAEHCSAWAEKAFTVDVDEIRVISAQ